MIKNRWDYSINDIHWLYNFQKETVQHYWPDFKSTMTGKGFQISGKWNDDGFKYIYHFEIIYNPMEFVNVKIIKPEILPCASIHMYDDGSLCLYHYREYPLHKQFALAFEIIPWTIEWTYWYEIWLRNGNIWKGLEARHG